MGRWAALAIALTVGAIAGWALVGADGTVPAKPTGLSVDSINDSGATISWDDPSDATITGYQILRRDRRLDDMGVFHPIVADTGSAATSYTDASVVPGESYVYRVKAINAAGLSQRSRYKRADVPASAAQLAPTGLTAERTLGVSLSWTAPEAKVYQVDGYRVQRATGDGDFANLSADTNSTDVSYVDSTADASTTYRYRVAALRGSDVSNWSPIISSAPSVSESVVEPNNDDNGGDNGGDTTEEEVVVEPETVDPPPAVTPTAEQLAPSGLSATESNGTVTLSWTAPASNADQVTAYDVQRFDSAEATVADALWAVLGSSTTLSDSTVSTGTTYRYRVAARRGSDTSDWTAEVTITTAPSAAQLTPTDLLLREYDADVTLTWTRPAFDANLSGYTVQRATADGEFSTLSDSLGANDNIYSDTTVAIGTTYRYRIAAQHGTTQSNWTDAASITTATAAQLAPSNLSARQTADAILLQWDQPEAKRGPITGYIIERATVGGEFSEIVSADDNRTDLSYTDASGDAETTYRYRVAAVRTIAGVATTSDWTDEASATTPQAAPVLVAVETPMVTGVLSSVWDATMTVGQSYSHLGFVSNKGSLSDATFTWQGYEVTVQNLYRNRGTLYMTGTSGSFSSDKQLARLDLSTLEETWALRLGDDHFLLSDAAIGYRGHRVNGVNTSWVYWTWTETGLSWSKDDDVAVGLNSIEQFIDPALFDTVALAYGARVASVTVDLTQVLDGETLHFRLTETGDSEAEPRTWAVEITEPSESVSLDIGLLSPETAYTLDVSWQDDFPEDYSQSRAFTTQAVADLTAGDEYAAVIGEVDSLNRITLWEATMSVDTTTRRHGYQIRYTQTSAQRDASTGVEQSDRTTMVWNLSYTKKTYGSLTSDRFDWDGVNTGQGVEYDINKVFLDDGRLTVWINVGRSDGRWNPNDVPFDFVFKVGNREFQSANALSRSARNSIWAMCDYQTGTPDGPCAPVPDGQRYIAFTWNASTLSWTHGQTVSLSLLDVSPKVISVETTALTNNSATVEVTLDMPVAGTLYRRWNPHVFARRMAHQANELEPIEIAAGTTTHTFTVSGLTPNHHYIVQASFDPDFDVTDPAWLRENAKFTTRYVGESGNRSSGLCLPREELAAIGDYYISGGTCVLKQPIAN